MARSRPDSNPKPPSDQAAAVAKAQAKAQTKQDDAVKWYKEVLGFPEPSAKALYINQTLTDVEVLNRLNNKQINAICNAIPKPGGAGKGEPIPVLAIERLKLAVFCINLYERTSRKLPE